MDNANPIDQDSDHEEAFQTWKSNMQEGAEECRREDTARREIINEMRQHKRNEPVMQHRLHNAKQSINDQLHRKGQRLLSPSPGPPAQSATEAAVDRANSGVQIRGVDPTSGTATWFVLGMHPSGILARLGLGLIMYL